MTTRTDTLVIGAGAAGLFCALRWAEHGSVTLVEAGPDAGNPLPRWGLYDYVLWLPWIRLSSGCSMACR